MGGRTILADTFAIVTGRSKVQTRAIADAIVEAARRHGYGVSRVEGYADGSWILIDLGNVIVHVFTPEQRDFYNLERFGRTSPSGARKPREGKRPLHQTRASRAAASFWMRLGVWIFIVFFALSVAGGLIIVTASLHAQ